MATKKVVTKMLMKDSDIAYRRRMLERWGYLCIVCGREFAHLACVTKEHIVPKSAQESLKSRENIGPSHFSCNQHRGANSIFVTARFVDACEQSMKPLDFHKWLNREVPNRIVPPHALKPLYSRRKRGFMELPEHLPGMP